MLTKLKPEYGREVYVLFECELVGGSFSNSPWYLQKRIHRASESFHKFFNRGQYCEMMNRSRRSMCCSGDLSAIFLIDVTTSSSALR